MQNSQVGQQQDVALDVDKTRAGERDFSGGFEQIDLRQESRHSGLSLRAIVIGFFIIILVAAAEPYNSFYKGNTYLIGNHFPIAVVFSLLVLILLVNPLLKRLIPGSQFAPSELVIIFILAYTACCVPGSGLMRYWMTQLTGGLFFTVDHPTWGGLVEDMPEWLFPSMERKSIVIQKFWYGFGENRTVPWETWSEIISAWAVPFLAWGVFFLSIFLCMWCIAALIRRQWVENEKLSFPLAQVALEIMKPPARGKLVNTLFRNKLLWITAGIVILIHTVNALSGIFPDIPKLPLDRDFGALYSNAPWNAAGWPVKWVRIYFTAIGIAYFITTRCSFSLWFFAFAAAMAPVVGAQFGYPIDAGIWRFHFVGAMLVLMGTMAWVSRAHLRLIFLSIIGRYKEPDNEYMSYRVAAILLIVSFAVAACWLKLAGMGILFAIVILTVLCMIFLTMARIVAETGVFFVQTSALGAMGALKYFTFPPVSKNSYLLGSILNTQFWDVRESHLPYAINALRAADGVQRIKRRRWLIPMLLIGTMVAFGVSAISYGYNAYSHGALSFADGWGAGSQPPAVLNTYNPVSTYKTVGNQFTFNPWVHTVMGALIMAVLAFARFRWTRWPLYPVGWLLANTYPMSCIWFSILLGWMAKSAILKFGGAGLYNRLKPMFIGLIIGDVITGGFASILILSVDIPNLKFWIMPG